MVTVHGRVRRIAWWAMMIWAWGLCAFAHAEEPGPRRVLVINSTRQIQQFFIITERDLPRMLGDRLGQSIDYYTEYLDFHRFTHPDYETAYIDFLRRKYEGRRLDLMFLMGTPAVDFVARHRANLFPDTPVVFYANSRPRGVIANSTGLVNRFQFGPSIDLALSLQPDLEHVFVVSGAAESDRQYEQQARAEFQAFDGRVRFTYFSGLVTSDLENRLKRLPSRSAVYFVVASEDGAGETFQQMAYLSRIAAAANAPTYSWADAAVETGIVGGRRRDQPAQMRAIASIALRLLRGERADDIPVSAPNTDVDSVDWRQLRRWNLNESRVPPTARLLFRPPSMWDQHWRYIVGAAALIVAQSALITGLLVQRQQRQRIERVLRGSQVKLRFSYDRIRQLSRRLLGEQEAERARIARELHDDINQQLTLLALELDHLRDGFIEAHTANRLARAQQTAHDVATSVRELSHRLHPSRLRLVGLVAAIEGLRRDLSPADLPIAFSHRGIPEELDPEIALCVFRVAQEALANAVKHSDARHVSVDLIGGPTGLALTVGDDGKGFDPDCLPNAGLGLTSMRERVESVGGILEICAAPEAGARLRVTVPLRAAEHSLDAVAT